MTGSKSSNIPGLYIHIPFCTSKCDYCNFYSVTDQSKISEFIECLLGEMTIYKHCFDRFDSVYVGGGTPSILKPKQMEKILEKIRRTFSLFENSEITCEVNPGGLSLNYLKALRDTGINRLNIGVQSFNRDILTFLGRRHSVSESIDALENSRKAGFKNIGLDLIYSIPGQDVKSWTNDLREALSFGPEHLSCYQLTLEPDTPLETKYQNGSFSMPDEELYHSFFFITSEIIEKAGYVHYEVSNFAREPNLQSRHNQKYWDHTPYLGLGPASHSFLKNKRWWNHRCLDSYISDIKEGKFPVGGEEYLSLHELGNETLYLGLRTKRGIDIKDFNARYNFDLLQSRERILIKLVEERLVGIKKGFLYPTLKGLALADSLYLEL